MYSNIESNEFISKTCDISIAQLLTLEFKVFFALKISLGANDHFLE